MEIQTTRELMHDRQLILSSGLRCSRVLSLNFRVPPEGWQLKLLVSLQSPHRILKSSQPEYSVRWYQQGLSLIFFRNFCPTEFRSSLSKQLKTIRRYSAYHNKIIQSIDLTSSYLHLISPLPRFSKHKVVRAVLLDSLETVLLSITVLLDQWISQSILSRYFNFQALQTPARRSGQESVKSSERARRLQIRTVIG